MEGIEAKLKRLKRAKDEDEMFQIIVEVERAYIRAIRNAERQKPPNIEVAKKNLERLLRFYGEALKFVRAPKIRRLMITSLSAWEGYAEHKKIEVPFVEITPLKVEPKEVKPITTLEIEKGKGPAVSPSKSRLRQQPEEPSVPLTLPGVDYGKARRAPVSPFFSGSIYRGEKTGAFYGKRIVTRHAKGKFLPAFGTEEERTTPINKEYIDKLGIKEERTIPINKEYIGKLPRLDYLDRKIKGGVRSE